jgi:hypothetical protein
VLATFQKNIYNNRKKDRIQEKKVISIFRIASPNWNMKE